MKKTNIRYIMGMAFLTLLVYSCNNGFENVDKVDVESNRKSFILAEAKVMFQERSLSRSLAPNKYLCVDFIPCWDKARYSKNGVIETVDVEISKEIHFLAVKKNDQGHTIYVKAPQMMTIVTEKDVNNITAYLATFIPDNYGFNSASFYTSGDKGGYSGLVIYTSTNNSTILMINKYKSGEKINSINIFTTDTTEIRKRQLIMQKQYLKDIHMFQLNRE